MMSHYLVQHQRGLLGHADVCVGQWYLNAKGPRAAIQAKAGTLGPDWSWGGVCLGEAVVWRITLPDGSRETWFATVAVPAAPQTVSP